MKLLVRSSVPTRSAKTKTNKSFCNLQIEVLWGLQSPLHIFIGRLHPTSNWNSILSQSLRVVWALSLPSGTPLGTQPKSTGKTLAAQQSEDFLQQRCAMPGPNPEGKRSWESNTWPSSERWKKLFILILFTWKTFGRWLKAKHFEVMICKRNQRKALQYLLLRLTFGQLSINKVDQGGKRCKTNMTE